MSREMKRGGHRYYFVVASLPELHFGEPPPLRMRDFLDAYGTEVREDRPLVDVILLRNDVRNLKTLLQGKGGGDTEESWVEPSVYSRQELEEAVSRGEGLPSFMNEYVAACRREDAAPPPPAMLDRGYLRYGASRTNEFLRKIFTFEIQLRNVVAGMRARRLGADVLSWVEADEGDLFRLKMSENRSAPDFGLLGEAPWIAPLLQSFEKDDPALVERSMDAVRFARIEEETDLMDFQTEVILAYLMKLQILERWAAFDAEAAAAYIETLTREAMEKR